MYAVLLIFKKRLHYSYDVVLIINKYDFLRCFRVNNSINKERYLVVVVAPRPG